MTENPQTQTFIHNLLFDLYLHLQRYPKILHQIIRTKHSSFSHDWSIGKMLTLPKIDSSWIWWKEPDCSSKSKAQQSAAIVQRNLLYLHMRKVVNQQPENLIVHCLQKCAILLHFPSSTINWISVTKDLLRINDWTFLSPSMRCNKSWLARDRHDRPLSDCDDLTWWRNESWNFLCWSSP